MGKRRFLLLGFILFTACQQDMQDFEPEPNIFAVAEIEWFGEDWFCLKVLVGQSYSMVDTVQNDPYGFGEYGLESVEGVEGAEVIITWSDDTAFFKEYVDYFPGLHLFTGESTQPQWINDSTQYTLNVYLPYGDTITGSAYMPTNLELIWPERNNPPETVSISSELLDSGLVCWNSCRNVSKYLIYCEREGILYGDFFPIPSVTADTCYPFFAERAVWPWEYDSEYELTVVGITKEYEDYLNQQSPGRSNLSSGYGVFTGITCDKLDVYIVE